MNGLENLKVGDKVTGLNTHGLCCYLTPTYVIAKVTSTLIVLRHFATDSTGYSFRIQDGTSMNDGKYPSTHYYDFNHPVIANHRKMNQTKIELSATTTELKSIIDSAESKFDLITKLDEFVKKNQLELAL
jgi:hypothetical protein